MHCVRYMALLTVLISERGVGDGKNSEKSAIKRGENGKSLRRGRGDQ